MQRPDYLEAILVVDPLVQHHRGRLPRLELHDVDVAAVVREGDAVVEGADRQPECVALPLRGLVQRVQLPPGMDGWGGKWILQWR